MTLTFFVAERSSSSKKRWNGNEEAKSMMNHEQMYRKATALALVTIALFAPLSKAVRKLRTMSARK